MQVGSLLLLLFVVSALFVIVYCQEDDVDRRDVHRIILKPEKSKKHKKRTKAPKTKQFRPHQPISSLEENVYEPTAHASSTRYQKHRERPFYPNHHDEYHDLIKPKPPRHEDATPYSYPEEESQYPETASSNQQNYVPYLQNSGGELNANAETQADVFVDWNPIPSTQLTHNDYHPEAVVTPSAASTQKRNKRKKKTRRTTTTTTTHRPVVIFMTSTPYVPPLTTTTTSRPLTYRDIVSFQAGSPPQAQPQVMKLKPKAPLHQQHHYVNYNHNNKSHIRYEVSGSSRPKGIALPPPQTPSTRYTNTQIHTQPVVAPSVHQPVYQTIHHNTDNSYEVFERAKDYNKQIKQTSFKSTLVPQPVYPQLQPFLPTVSTYTIVAKSTKAPLPSQLDFGKKQVPLVPNVGFGKLYLGGVN